MCRFVNKLLMVASRYYFNMKRTALLLTFVALIGFSSAATAEGNVNTAIVASTANYPDAMVGAAASNKIGAPILLTDKASLSASTGAALENMSVDEVVMLGGPAVISEDVEAEIDTLVNSTTRLWGVSQIGTSVETSQYFWTESDEATIVQYPINSDKGYKLLAAVKNDVQDEDEPILISKPGTLSANTLSEVQRLNATEVEVYSTSSVNVTEDLESIGVEEISVTEGDMNRVTQEVENRTVDSNVSNLVVVAAADFRHAISVPTAAHGASVIVSSEADIQKAVDKVNEATISEVKVVGNPDLAEMIAEELRNSTEAEIKIASGKPDETAAEQALEQRKNWSQIQEKRRNHWEEKVRNSKGLRVSANATLTKAEATATANSSQKAQKLLQEARAAFQEGNYFEARKMATSAVSQAKMNRFRDMSREQIREEYRDETEDLKASVRKLKQLGRKQAQMIQEAESQEERVEIIREMKEERRELREDIREEKQGQERNERNTEEEETEEKQTGEDEEKENESLATGEASVDIAAGENSVKASMNYMASTGGYSVESSTSRDGDIISFSFDLTSPEGMATQVLTEMEDEAQVGELEAGNYTVKAVVSVDGEQVFSTSSEVSVE